MLKVLDVDGAVRRVRGGWESTGLPWSYDEDRYERVAATRRHEQAAMVEYARPPRAAWSTCGGARRPGARGRAAAATTAAGSRCRRGAGRRVTPARERLDSPACRSSRGGSGRRRWRPLGVELRGTIPAAERAEPGRAVARMTDLGWGDALRALFRDDAPDAEVRSRCATPSSRVLDAWPFEDRPDTVVHVESLRRPTLVTHLAEGLRATPACRWRRSCGSCRTPRRARARRTRRSGCGWWRRATRMDDPGAVAGRSVLLVDDRTDTAGR
jgi:ATP-dependent DNA helicase RecQ